MGKVKLLSLYLTVLILAGSVAFVSAPYVRQVLLNTGIITEKVLIAGTGSMYPTFPKGEGTTDVIRAQEIVAWPKMRHFPTGINILGMSLFSYKLQKGDIVDFENEKTKEISKQQYGEEAGFVKRIVALSGDSIILRDGYVMVNGQLLSEPYTAKPRSTFGGSTIADCQDMTVPQGKVFVMGDNRKASMDSRFELGLVSEKDIKYVMPRQDQGDYEKSFRDTSGDSALANTTTLDSGTFVKLLNDKRAEKNLASLKLNSLLSNSSKIRGNIMMTTDDFSSEATKSGVTLEKAFKEAGYHNIISAEIFTRGYYEADELLDNFLEFPSTRDILFSGQYQDIGLSPVLGNINNCPVQVVVVQLGGYVAPDYKQEDIESWKKLSDNLNQAIPSWEALRGIPQINQTKLNQLLDILHRRQDTANKIYARMSANQWLTDQEVESAKNDNELAKEANAIIADLNK